MPVRNATDKEITDWAKTLVGNANVAVGCNSSLTEGVRELIIEMIKRIETTPQ